MPPVKEEYTIESVFEKYQKYEPMSDGEVEFMYRELKRAWEMSVLLETSVTGYTKALRRLLDQFARFMIHRGLKK